MNASLGLSCLFPFVLFSFFGAREARLTLCVQSTVMVWAGVNGAIFGGIGLLLVIEYTFASCGARAGRDITRTGLAFLCVFSIAWLIAGNVWIFDRENGGSGVVVDSCANGNLGNRNLYHFCYVIIIIQDVLYPLIWLYILARTCLNKTFSG